MVRAGESSLVITMKLSFFLVLGVLVVANLCPVHALDCGKASLPVEKLFCATPELKKADEAMSTAYSKLLRDTTDPDFHEALIRSQRRWLEVRSHGADRFGAAENDRTDDSKVLLAITRDRLTFLRTAKPIRAMEEQRKIAANDSGGSFAGYQTSSCFFSPPPYGNWSYVCLGAAHRQHNGRVCSVATEWASGHTTEYRLVSVLRNGEPRPVASCSTGYAETSEQCPEPDDDAAAKAFAHWNADPKPSNELPAPHAGGLWRYDPDIQPRMTDQQWMRDCLFASTYPPPEVSRANSSPQK
ncbi:lysozyme inhibitor LprI family protein [Bradyrhizobium sp. CB2312]|uniref:lysozyme inhibitor LprI family protein n=1 Tax=Bradyrhizobium sp. CB2312 TaxID=3039155 RepID=UPI0024B0F99F|nr:lysozyme inhibitor LprI family protein [Bradyrhizobium sp. CB2312]WFU73224.1 lysozyme inhibitor LprI family protein [Bradyrhizobium sp. CB2312]